MIKLVLMQLTKEYALYRYYPDGREFYGSVLVNRLNGEIKFTKESPHYEEVCRPHVYGKLRTFFLEKNYPQQQLIAFC